MEEHSRRLDRLHRMMSHSDDGHVAATTDKERMLSDGIRDPVSQSAYITVNEREALLTWPAERAFVDSTRFVRVV